MICLYGEIICGSVERRAEKSALFLCTNRYCNQHEICWRLNDMKTLRVLSIDMDFFQNVDYHTLIECYPDGHDYPSALSTIVWQLHYSNPYERPQLDKVTCPEHLLDALKSLLCKQKSDTPVLITQSHVFIYPLIESEMDRRECESLDIVNIDMHHDMFYDPANEFDVGGVHCGNWAHHIRKRIPTAFTWISNKVSSEAMNYDEIADLDEIKIIESDLTPIEDNQFDVIFLCRSDSWYPPHLDAKFDELVAVIKSKFEDVTIKDEPTSRKASLSMLNIIQA